MITNNQERMICDKYSAIDENGKVHCNECPLRKGNPETWDFRCKANSHYDYKTGEWEFDGIFPWSKKVVNKSTESPKKQATSDYASEWIPCSERLPENNEWVLCTIDYSNKQVVTVIRREGSSRWFDIDDWSYDFDVVTAWMPLPEPYKEGE